MSSVEANIENTEPEKVSAQAIDWKKISQHPSFVPACIILVSIVICFWGLVSKLPKKWFDSDGYYSHGIFVPLISGYIIYKWWEKFKEAPKTSKLPTPLRLMFGDWNAAPMKTKAFWPALIGVLGLLAVQRAAFITGVDQFMSLALLGVLVFGAWFVLGGNWMLRLLVPIGYLLFMLPVFTAMIDNYTNPLQQTSTEVALGILKVLGFNPYALSTTEILVGSYSLNVGVPCSGFKLLIAVSAFTILFMCIARLNFWGNLIMFSSIVPLCLFINGLRIALIGIVGDLQGQDAAHVFHDYSGYITLLLCFFLLFKMARWLGWKD